MDLGLVGCAVMKKYSLCQLAATYEVDWAENYKCCIDTDIIIMKNVDTNNYE